MGARGKKRVRANDQIASGKQKPLPRPGLVPPAEPEQVLEGLDVLRTALAEHGHLTAPVPSGRRRTSWRSSAYTPAIPTCWQTGCFGALHSSMC